MRAIAPHPMQANLPPTFLSLIFAAISPIMDAGSRLILITLICRHTGDYDAS